MVFASPELDPTQYPYDSCHDGLDCYSPPVVVSGARVSVAPGEAYFFQLSFDNNDHNVQLLFDLGLKVEWD